MSRNTFSDNTGNTVIIGWDRMLSHYFMGIFNEEDCVYTSISEEDDILELQYFLNILKEKKIELPQEMIEACIVDKELNLGNEVRFFDENGLK